MLATAFAVVAPDTHAGHARHGCEVFDLVDQALLCAQQIDLVIADQGTHRVTSLRPGVGAVARQMEAQVVGGGVERLGLHAQAQDQAQHQNDQPLHGCQAAHMAAVIRKSSIRWPFLGRSCERVIDSNAAQSARW